MTEYVLTLDGPNDQIQLIWDPQISSLRHRVTDRAVDLSRVGRAYLARHYCVSNKVSPENPGLKRSPRVVKINMGFQCNYSCAYCNQAAHVGSPNGRMAEVRTFLAGLPKWFDGGPDGDGTGCRFEFWGGEPLIYWKHLQVLAGTLRSLYPQAAFNLITNGSLLTDEIVDWLDELDFHVSISHDGPAQHIRNPDDILDDPKKVRVIRRLWGIMHAKQNGGLGFGHVLTRGNYSLGAIKRHIAERLDVPPHMVNSSTEEILLPYDDAGLEQIPQSEEEHQAALHTLFVEAISGESLPGCHSVRRKIEDLFDAIAASRPAWSLSQKCGMDDERTIAVNTKGEVTTCHNTAASNETHSGRSHRIGHVDALHDVKLDTAHHMATRDECSRCPVVQMCKGSCMFLEGKYWRSACDVSFTYNLSLFAAALFFLTGGYVLTRLSGPVVRRDDLPNEIDIIDVDSIVSVGVLAA